MKPLLSPHQCAWVETTLASMTPQEKIGHLLCPQDMNYSSAEWEALLQKFPLGSAYFARRPAAEVRELTQAMQAASRIPLLLANDLEHGAGGMLDGLTDFPTAMALGAANDDGMACQMGAITAREGCSVGLHWTFSPVLDPNYNFQNPITNIRAFGDSPETVSRLGAAVIHGLQENGMAATAKHFPGDGMDDRDQHLCTTVNSMSVKKWRATYGRIWKSAIKAGVQTAMIGHISLPAFQGCSAAQALPATLDPRLQMDLLRSELGFNGLILSDALPMGGITSRVSPAEKGLRNLLAGSDLLLYCDPERDFALLLDALRAGRLPLDKVNTSVRRMLELKAALHLNEITLDETMTTAELGQNYGVALKIARQSITLLRPSAATPVRLSPGDRILTVTLRHEHQVTQSLPVVDEQLRQRGFQVDHLEMPDPHELAQAASKVKAVFVNVVVQPHSQIGSIRLTGMLAFAFWEAFYVDHPQVVFTSFGSPYLLYEFPHLPNLYLAYGNAPVSQQAAVEAWLGEFALSGRCPVALPFEPEAPPVEIVRQPTLAGV
jgi:beta-N-acetylhexosaminidase